MGETQLEGANKRLVHRSKLLVAKLHIVDAYKSTIRAEQVARYLLGRSHSHREVATLLTTIHDTTLEVGVIGEEILRDILSTTSAAECGKYITLDTIISGTTLRTEHRSTYMLRTQEEASRLEAQGLAGRTVRVATYLLEHIHCKDMTTHTYDTPTILEEVLGLEWQHREDIVVEIEKLLIKTLYIEHMQLNSVAIKCWQMLSRDYVTVKHHIDLLAIDPLGDLALGRDYEVYLADKWHILLNATKQVSQSTPITKTLLEYWGICGGLILLLPHGIESIDKCNDYIHKLFEC